MVLVRLSQALTMGAAGDRADRTTFQVAMADHLPLATMAELRRDLERGYEMTWQPVGVAGTGLNRRHGTRQGHRVPEGNSDGGERGARMTTQQSGRSRAGARLTPRAGAAHNAKGQPPCHIRE
jgi:hypothetical protein